jgi:hypothetical protein
MPDHRDASALFAARDADPVGYTTRAFRWLAAGAAKGNAEDQYDQAAMAYAWTFIWTSVVEPKMVGADFIKLGLDAAPDDAVDAIVSHAEVALPHLDSDFVLATTGTPEQLTPAKVARSLEAFKAARAP